MQNLELTCLVRPRWLKLSPGTDRSKNLNPYFITGTGTDIGKTWLSCALLKYWRANGVATRAYKPVLSGFIDADADAALSDAGALLQAQGFTADHVNFRTELERISPWRYSAPLSPDMAAALEGRGIDFAELVAYVRRVTSTNWQTENILVEGVGGVMVPLDDIHTVRDWITACELPCVLVTGSYLGSLSHTLTAINSLTHAGVRVDAIVVNESVSSSVPLSSTMASLIRHAGGHRIIAIERDNPSPGIAQVAMHLESRPVYTARHPDQPL